MKKLWIAISAFFIILCPTLEGNAFAKERQADELVLALTKEPRLGFDPTVGLDGAGNGFVHSTLLSLNEKMEITYDLAEEYQVSEDKLKWEFKIRDDARFTDGQKVTAHDVAFTFQLAKDKGKIKGLEGLKRAQVIDDYTVQFLFEKPLSSFVYSVSSIGIVSSESYDEGDEREPVGSGPYQLVKWNKGKEAVFVRNDGYYGHQPFFRRIKVLFVSEDEAYAMAKEGEADLVQSTGVYAGDKVAGMETLVLNGADNRGLSLVTVPAGAYLNGTATGNDVTMDPAIRQAIHAGIDREKIVEKALNGYGQASMGAASGLPWGQSEKAVTNKDKAEELLRIGGWVDSDGDGVLEKKGRKAIFTVVYPFDDSLYKAMSLELKQQLAEMGINIILKESIWPEMKRSMQSDATLIKSDSYNPFDIYYLYHSNNRGVGYGNPSLYASETVDNTIEHAFLSGDFAEWKKAEEIALEDVPIVWLANVSHVYFVKEGLRLGNDMAPSAYPLSVLNGAENWRME